MAVAKSVLTPIGILLDAVHPEKRARMSFRPRVCGELSEGVDGQLSPCLIPAGNGLVGCSGAKIGPLYEGRMELVAPEERPWNQALSLCLAMSSRDHQESGVPAGNAWARRVPRYRTTYERMLDKRGPKIARVVVARMMLRSIHKMLRAKVRFNRLRAA